MRLLLTSQAGPPDDPRTWSGTPSLMLAALAREGQLDPRPWSGRCTGWSRRLSGHADGLLGLRHSFIPGPVRRYLAGRAVSRAARRMHCAAVLHLGTYDLGWSHDGLPRYLYVDTSYDLWERQSPAAQGLSSWQRRCFRSLELSALRQLQHVFTIGQHVADSFIETFGLPRERVSAVGAGLGAVRPYYGPKNYDNEQLLMVAKVRPRDKGLSLALAAFARLREVRPAAQLTIVGAERYPELVGQAGVRGTGWISLEELQALFEKAALFLMPALYEPWGLSYLEALACRTPIVGLARNAFPEISGHGRYGFSLEAATPEALAALLHEALADPERLQRMGREGQQHALRQYTWERAAAEISRVILRTQDS